MNSSTKTYSYYDFKLSQESSRIKKSELTISDSYNIDTSNSIIKPAKSLKNYFKQNLSNEIIQVIEEENSNFLESICFVYEYSYQNTDLNKTIKRIFLLNESLQLFELNAEIGLITDLLIQFNSLPSFFESNSNLYILSKSDKFICFEQNNPAMYITNFCNINYFCKYQDYILFSYEENKFSLFYSNDSKIENLGANTSFFSTLELNPSNGEILSINLFGGYVYAVQQYAISRLNFSNNTFTISSHFPISSNIIKNSIGQLDDYIIFCTNYGIFIFDGSNLKCIFNSLQSLISFNKTKCKIFNEKYYLLCDMKLNEDTKRVVVEFDIKTNSHIIFLIDSLEDIYLIKNYNSCKLIFKTNSTEKLLEFSKKNFLNNNSYIKFNKLMFEESNSKFLSSINIFSKGKYNIKITSDFGEKNITVDGNLKLRNIGLSGNYFQVEIYSNENFAIEAFQFFITSYAEKL